MDSVKNIFFIAFILLSLSISTQAMALYCYDPYYNVYHYCGGYDYYPTPDGSLYFDLSSRPDDYFSQKRWHHYRSEPWVDESY